MTARRRKRPSYLSDAWRRYVLVAKIPAGRYYVSAGSFGSAGDGAFPAGGTKSDGVRVPAPDPYLYAYYPGTSDTNLAGWIDVAAGVGIQLGDLVVRRRELFSIRGRVIDNTTGKPPACCSACTNSRHAYCLFLPNIVTKYFVSYSRTFS